MAVVALLLVHGVPPPDASHSLDASSSVTATSQQPCRIKGFETYCAAWNSCQQAPEESVSSGDGRCLYSRISGWDASKTPAETDLGASYKRVNFLSQGFQVVRLAKAHCTPEGRGDAILAAGWFKPDTSYPFFSVVFAAPCAVSTGVNFNNMMLPGWKGSRDGWRSFAPSTWVPVVANWQGLKSVILTAYNNTAADMTWMNLAGNYSFYDGGLGPPGANLHAGVSFNEVLRRPPNRGPAPPSLSLASAQRRSPLSWPLRSGAWRSRCAASVTSGQRGAARRARRYRRATRPSPTPSATLSHRRPRRTLASTRPRCCAPF